MKKNRNQRRHPFHHSLPLPRFSGERISVQRTPESGVKPKGKKVKKRIT